MNPARFMAGVKAAENHPAVEHRICERAIWEAHSPAALIVYGRRKYKFIARWKAWERQGGFK